MRKRNKKNIYRFLKDLSILIISIIIAIALAKSGAIDYLLNVTENAAISGSFLAGIFFTSILTLSPATVVLAEIARSSSLLTVAAFGAAGAVIGDLVIFLFVRDSISESITGLVKTSRFKKITSILKHKRFKWISPAVGALIIASPLPDELGIALMGFSKMKTSYLVPISYVMNFFGILLVGLIARSLV